MGLKFKGGKFVERTEEEERRIQAYFAEIDAAKPIPRQKKQGRFIQITSEQLDKLLPNPAALPVASVFFILCFNSFRHRGAAFIFPAEHLTEIGISPWTQRRAVNQLEKFGLISVERRHKKPPVVRVL